MPSSVELRPLSLSPALLAKVAEALQAIGLDLPTLPPGGPIRTLDEAAAALGVGRDTVLRGLATLARMPYVDLRQISPAPQAVHALPESLARRFRCLPLFLNGAELTIAVGGPRELNELDAVSAMLPQHEIIFVLADEELLVPLIGLCYPSAATEAVARYLVAVGDGTVPAATLRALGEQPPVVEMVNAIIARAITLGASDIHLEPFQAEVRVRLRVDGRLRLAFTYDISLHEAMISRLKIMADLNILERSKPQDGRLVVREEGRAVDARISLLRMADGEKAVIRLLRGAMGRLLRLEELGLPEPELASLCRLLAQPHGLILVTGPTGSGKSSTLYGALDHLNSGDRNLVTIEDPVEYRLMGVNQVPVQPDQDVSFATALRAILRQDPDVIMVGEIRDGETAQIAIRAALTGHLVLSTLHTNDAVETITRLREMGVDGGDLAPALLGVVAQRLVRRLCRCHDYEPATPERLADLGLSFLEPGTPLPRPVGCVHCDGQGYLGRVVLFELLLATAEVKADIVAGANTAALAAAARRAGLRPMAWTGAQAMLEGLTTPDEVLRVAPRPV